MKTDEFYVGYHAQAPPALGAWIRRVVIALLGGSALLAVLFVISQQHFYPSVFEYLQYRAFEGTISVHPYPVLQIERPGTTLKQSRRSDYYLVDEGKFGAQNLVAGLDGEHVRLQGALIYRDDRTMIEVLPGTVAPIAESGMNPTSRGTGRSLGRVTLRGEIVDSKCFLGVMNPGSGKTHRACAARCISGGIPPALAVQQASGETQYLLLTSAEGRTVNQEVLDKVAEPVEITGEAVQYDDLLVLRADPATYRRLNP